jgi:hypothetical protein
MHVEFNYISDGTSSETISLSHVPNLTTFNSPSIPINQTKPHPITLHAREQQDKPIFA